MKKYFVAALLTACGSPQAPLPQPPTPINYPHTVTTGSCDLVWTQTGEHIGPVQTLPDVDDNGVPELITVATAPPFSVFVRSGRTGALISRANVAVTTIDSTALVGDVDGDGTPDLAIGSAPQMGNGSCDLTGNCGGTPGLLGDGTITVVSTRTGTVLWTKTGTPSDRLGSTMGSDVDEDGDGVADIVVGTTTDDAAGHVMVLSARTGALIRMLSNPVDASQYFANRVIAGDLDGNGNAEVIATDNGGPSGTFAGEVLAYSPKGDVMWTFAGDKDFLGDDVAVVGDLDADGYLDLMVGAHEHAVDGLGTEVGRVIALSGKTGNMLWTIDGTLIGEELGAVAAGPDVNGDGVLDVLVGAPADARGDGYVLGEPGRFALLDGKSGTTLVGVAAVIGDDATSDRLGETLISMGMLENKALLVVGAPTYSMESDGARDGLVTAWSCSTH